MAGTTSGRATGVAVVLLVAALAGCNDDSGSEVAAAASTPGVTASGSGSTLPEETIAAATSSSAARPPAQPYACPSADAINTATGLSTQKLSAGACIYNVTGRDGYPVVGVVIQRPVFGDPGMSLEDARAELEATYSGTKIELSDAPQFGDGAFRVAEETVCSYWTIASDGQRTSVGASNAMRSADGPTGDPLCDLAAAAAPLSFC